MKTVKAKSHIAKLTALSLLATMLFGGAASADSVKVTADELNIRKDADVKSRIVGLVEEGDELSFVSENGDWYQVKNGDDTGFVLKDYVELDTAKMEEDIRANTETFSQTQSGKASFRVNMRSLPTTAARAVAIIERNETVKITGRCGVWYLVERNGKTGYVMAQYIAAEESGQTVAPVQPESGSDYASSQQGKATADVKLRTAPSTGASIADIIEEDDSVTVLGESGEWYKVSFNGQTGYAVKEYISVSGQVPVVPDSGVDSALTLYSASKPGETTARVNMRKEASTGGSIVTVVEKGASITLLGEAGSWYRVSSGQYEGYIAKEWVKAGVATFDTAKTGEVTTEIKFRSEPSTNGSLLKLLSKGTKVTVTAQEGEWYKIQVDGQEGYAAAEYIRIVNVSSDNGDVVVPDNFVSYPAARNGAVNERVNLRQAASTSSQVVSVLEEGAAVSVLGEQGAFYQVKQGSLFGYIVKDYVTLGGTGVENNQTGSSSSVNDTIYTTGKSGKTTVRVNMRRAPEGDILFTLAPDTEVTMIGEAGSWYKVKYSNSEGYIAKMYVTESVVVAPQPETGTDSDSQTIISGQGTTGYIIGSSVNMRRGAGTDSGVIRVLHLGDEVTFYTQTDGWYVVKVGSDTGYVSAKYISTTKPTASSGTNDSNAGTPAQPDADDPQPATGKVQQADWFKSSISKDFAVGDIVTVTDVETGISWRVKRSGGYNHADVQPLTAEDTAKMKKVYGGTWSWNRRAIWVTVDGVRYAASMNGMPHGTGSITTNNFDGHHCIHFLNSRTHTGNRWDTAHQNMVQKAYKAGQ